MGLFSAFEKVINIENINLGCKKTREEDCIKKLNAIFSIVAKCLIDQRQMDEKVPKEICEFILNNINREISFLQKQKQASINAVRQQVEFKKENFMMQNPNMMFSSLSCHQNIDKQYDNHFQSQERAIEQNYIEKQQKVLKEIISQYHNGTRLNDTDFNKLCSFFKDNQQIEECYNVLIKSP